MNSIKKVQLGYSITPDLKRRFNLKCKKLMQSSNKVIEILILNFLEMKDEQFFNILVKHITKPKDKNK